MQYKSDFEPKLEVQNKYRILDPNPNGNQTVPPEDLYIYVSLKAKQKSKSFFEVKPKSNLIEISTFGRNTFDLLVPQENVTNELFKNKPEGLTTDWTEIGGFQQKELYKDFETFGITNIDISIKSQVAPQVTIDFVDVRGATLFEQGSCSPYGLFFSLPYPIFELTLKGYYGKAVNYYLNLTKFTTKFNSETGNMECRAEFIGYTFAFLSDVIVGYVMASQYLDSEKYSPKEILADFYALTNEYYGKSGTDPFCVDGKCTTIMDLLKSIDKFEDYEKPRIAGSDEYKEVGAYNELFEKYKKYLETLNDLAKELSERSTRTVTACEDNKVKGTNYKFLIDKNTRPELVKDKKTSLISKYFKRTNEGLLTNIIKEIMLTKINNSFVYEATLKNGEQIKCLLKNPGQFRDDDPDTKVYQMYDSPDLKNKPWFIGILKDSKSELGLSYPPAIDNEIEYLQKNENLIPGEQVSSIIDLGYLIADAKRELELIDETIKEKKKVLLNEINRIVESDIGFKPTIKNIFTVLLCNTDAFMEILRRVGVRAEDHHLQYNNTSTNRKNKNGNYILSGEEKVYAWPTYSEKGKEKYPGENTDFLEWPEVIFVEDFIKAYFDMNRDVELLNNETEGKVGFDNFVPINPIESRYWDEQGATPTPTKYLKTLEDGGKKDEILQVIVERMFLTLDYSQFQPIRKTSDTTDIPKMIKDYKNNTLIDTNGKNSKTFIEQLAKIDSWNLLNAIDNKKNLEILAGVKPEEIFGIVKNKVTNNNGLFEEVKFSEVSRYNSFPGLEAFNLLFTKEQQKEDYYVFMADKDRGVNIKEDIWVHPNPFTQIEKNGVNSVIKFLSENEYSSFEQNDPIKLDNPKFKEEVTTLKQEYSRTTQDLDFETNNYKRDNPNWPFGNDNTFFTWDDKQQIMSFDKPQLYTTLAATYGKAIKSNWWISNQLPTNLENYMGVLSYWDDNGALNKNATNLLSFTTVLPRNWVSLPPADKTTVLTFYTEKMYEGTSGSKAREPVELESGNILTKMYPAVNINKNHSCNKDYLSIATATLITSPLWLDNVNNFRKKTRGDSAQYDEPTQYKNLAYLFLNTLKPTPLIKRLIDDDGYLYNGYKDEQTLSSIIWSLRSFNTMAGIAKVPKFWLLALGSQLWRWKTFVGVDGDVWRKPLSSKNDKFIPLPPKGKDPLIQPGFNPTDNNEVTQLKRSGNISTNNGINQIKTGDNDYNNSYKDKLRNNPVFYLNQIYDLGVQKESQIFQYQSVFSGNRKNTKDQGSSSILPDSDTYIININTFDEEPVWFQYFNLYKNEVGKIGDVMKTITPEEVVKNYSWPQTYIAPHHIPYISSELFWSGKKGRGSDFVLLTDGYIGYQDYVTIMPQKRKESGTYNEVMGYTNSAIKNDNDDYINKKSKPFYVNRNKNLDGNLGMVLQYLPDEIKNEIVKKFEDWATGDGVDEWKSLIKIIDPVNFDKAKLTLSYDYITGQQSPAVNGYCPSNDEEGFGYVLALKQNDSLKKLYNQQYWIVNTTPKIWYGYQKKGEFNGTSVNTFYDKGFLVSQSQYNLYLETFLTEFNKNKNERKKELSDKDNPENNDNPLDVGPIDDTDVKLSLYRTFKSMTDKWISASKDGKLFFNITQSEGRFCRGQYDVQRKTIASHFQYVNRTMGDIGDVAVINILKLNELRENKKISLYSYLADLLVDNQYEFFPLPATIDLTGSGVSGEDLKDMFRPYIGDVTDISCGPSFICMYVGGGSRQIKLSNNTKCPIDKDMLQSIEDDGFGFTDIDLPEDISGNGPDENGVDSQGYTAFKILYGIQNQNHFKSIQLDQSEFSETAESILVLDKLSQQGADKKAIKGQNLNAAYLTRSYSCQVESLGNMMIQPMTYFDLQGVPMFSGAFLITEVSHNFKPNNASTNFKGVRQPRATVPIVTDVAVAMNISFKDVKAIDSGSITGIGGTRRSGGSSGSNGASLQGISYSPIKIGNIRVEPTSPFMNNDAPAFKTGQPEWIVLHWAAGFTFDGEISALKKNSLHYHLTIDVDGTLHQLSDLNKVAYHAGCPPNKTGPCHSMNHKSIGISYIGGVEKFKDGGDTGYVRTNEEWEQENLNYGNDTSKSWYSNECAANSTCKKTTYKAKAQFDSIVNAILVAKNQHPTIRGITSHHLTSRDKVDVGDGFPWAKLFKEIKDRTTKMGTPWEPIFGDKFYDTEGQYVGELVRVFGDPNFVNSSVTALSEYNQFAGVQIPADSKSISEIYNKLNDKIQNPNLVWGIMGNIQNESTFTSNAAGDKRDDQSKGALKVEGSNVINSSKKQATGFYCSYGYTQLNVCGGGGSSFLKYNNLENVSDIEKIKALTDSNKHLEWVIKRASEIYNNGVLPVTKQDTIENWAIKWAADYERCSECANSNSVEVKSRVQNAITLSKSNVSISLPASNTTTKTVVIGDSQSLAISKKATKTFLSTEQKGWKVGWSMKDLATALNNNTEDDTVANIVMSIGTNGGFNTGDVNQTASLIKGLKKSYPFAKKIFLVKGSWGWGGLNNLCTSGSEQTNCPKVEAYYATLKNTLSSAGYSVEIIPTAIGYTQDHPSLSTASYTTIGNEINSKIT